MSIKVAQVFLTTRGIEKAHNTQEMGIKLSLTRAIISSHLITEDEERSITSWSDVMGEKVLDTDTIQQKRSIFVVYNNLVNSKMGITIDLTLGLSIGNFLIGHVGYFLDDETLFAILKLNQVIEKIAQSDVSLGNSIDLTLQLAVIYKDILNITIQKTHSLYIPEIPSYSDLPDPNTSYYSIYVVDNFSGTDQPALAVRIINDSNAY